MSETQSPKVEFFRLLGHEILLGTLVALLSVLTGLAAYMGSLADGEEAEANVEGQKVLSLSNTEFLRANQDIIQDYTMYDGYYVNADTNPEVAEYYEANFSDSLVASMERPDGPFDEAYYDEIYQDADESYNEAAAFFDKAQAAGDKADRYQMVLMLLAVSLALSAWASILKEESNLRPIFGLLSLAVGVFGIIQFVLTVLPA